MDEQLNDRFDKRGRRRSPDMEHTLRDHYTEYDDYKDFEREERFQSRSEERGNFRYQEDEQGVDDRDTRRRRFNGDEDRFEYDDRHHHNQVRACDRGDDYRNHWRDRYPDSRYERDIDERRYGEGRFDQRRYDDRGIAAHRYFERGYARYEHEERDRNPREFSGRGTTWRRFPERDEVYHRDLESGREDNRRDAGYECDDGDFRRPHRSGNHNDTWRDARCDHYDSRHGNRHGEDRSRRYTYHNDEEHGRGLRGSDNPRGGERTFEGPNYSAERHGARRGSPSNRGGMQPQSNTGFIVGNVSPITPSEYEAMAKGEYFYGYAKLPSQIWETVQNNQDNPGTFAEHGEIIETLEESKVRGVKRTLHETDLEETDERAKRFNRDDAMRYDSTDYGSASGGTRKGNLNTYEGAN